MSQILVSIWRAIMKSLKLNKIVDLLLAMIFAVLICAPRFSALTIVAWVLVHLIQLAINKTSQKRNPFILLLPLLYLFYLIGLFWTSNMDEGIFDLEVKMSLFIFPLFFFLDPLGNERLKFVFKCLLFGLALNFLLLLGNALFLNEEGFKLTNLFYANFSHIIHPSYMGFYVNSIFIVVAFDLFKRQFNLFETDWLYYLMIAFLGLFSLMLVSKVGLMMAFVLLLWILWQWIKQKKILLVFAFLGLAVISTISVYKSSTYVSSRIDEFFEGVGDGPQDNYLYSTSIRLVVWEVAWENVKESPVYGYGTGDVGDVLLEDYQAQDIVRVKDLNLNAHNQFLQTSLALGLLGGLLLLAILFYPLIKTDRQVELYALFLLNTLFFFFSESVIETQAGTVGFTLFYVLYFSIAKQSKTESN